MFPSIAGAFDYSCQCVPFARNYVRELPALDAQYFPLLPSKFRSVPVVGGIVVLQYEDTFHVAVITELREKGVMVIEKNYKPCSVTERLVEWTDPHLVTFMSFSPPL